MQDAKEEVRARLSVEDVIGEYIQLKRAGRNLKGLSPFTDEKTPSFMVSPEKQIWHDFSSGKGGDIYSFIMLVEGMDFRQSLEFLARKAGVELEMYSRGDGRMAKRRTRAKEALKLAARFYQQVFLRTPKALKYVGERRGFGKRVIENFAIGFAPDDGKSLIRALSKRGFSLNELKDAGLTNRFGGDLFRGRMVVALMDSGGDVIGFTGRIIKDEPNSPKYLNTPQTILFDKSRHIFGLSQAKEAIRKADVAVIVEGNLDVVSSHQAGVKNVVATAGTAMTEQHLRALSRLTGRIRLAFDQDRAGLTATERTIGLAQDVGVELEVVTLPGGAKDPDELIRQDVNLWKNAIRAAQPAVDWVIEQYKNREDLSTAEGKRIFSTAALKLLKTLKDPVEKEHYLTKISKITGASMQALEVKLNSDRPEPIRLKISKAKKVEPQKSGDDVEDILLGLAIIAPQTRRWLSAIEAEMLEAEEARATLEELNRDSEVDLREKIPKNLQKYEQYVKIVQLKSDTRYANWESDSLSEEMARLVRQIIIKNRETKKERLLNELRQAEESGDEPKSQELRQKLNALIKEKL